MLKRTLSLTVILLSLIGIFILTVIAAYGLKLYLNPNRPKGLLTSGPVTTVPTAITLNLSNPDDNLLVYDANLLIQGKISPVAIVIVSTNKENRPVETSGRDNFSLTVKLDSGLNQISVVAFDGLGNLKREDRTVYYSTEKL